ncbi:10041_t:CDS:2, partial [Acaulospora colombiana]
GDEIMRVHRAAEVGDRLPCELKGGLTGVVLVSVRTRSSVGAGEEERGTAGTFSLESVFAVGEDGDRLSARHFFESRDRGSDDEDGGGVLTDESLPSKASEIIDSVDWLEKRPADSALELFSTGVFVLAGDDDEKMAGVADISAIESFASIFAKYLNCPGGPIKLGGHQLLDEYLANVWQQRDQAWGERSMIDEKSFQLMKLLWCKLDSRLECPVDEAVAWAGWRIDVLVSTSSRTALDAFVISGVVLFVYRDSIMGDSSRQLVAFRPMLEASRS